ncbi:hypothetical protein [Streptomyces sp. NPDC002644]
MSYIRSNKVDEAEVESIVDREPSIDASLDDEILDFVLELISEVNNLREGEALVVWKEIF